MPLNFIIRSLAFSSLYFAIVMPVITKLIELFAGNTQSIFFWIPMGAFTGLIFGMMQLTIHYRQIEALADKVNEDTVWPIREFEILLDEKMDPAMEIIKDRLGEKNWKFKKEDKEEGVMIFSVNKHFGWPYKFQLRFYPRNDGKTLLQVLIKPPFLEDYLPDLGKSLRYAKELKTALL